MVDEKKGYLCILGILIPFVLYLFLDSIIPEYYKILVFILLVIGSEIAVFLSYNYYKNLKIKKEEI